MKKNIIKILPLLLIITSIIFAKEMSLPNNKIEHRINPNLKVIKENWKGNVVIDGKFQNDSITQQIPLSNVLKWTFSRNPQRKEKRNDTFTLQTNNFNPSSVSANSIVWLGHASFLININGVRIITDPSFFNLFTNKRKVAVPCPIDSLKQIDYLLISHDHRDHFDKKSVKTLIKNNPEIEALIPLNGSRLFSKNDIEKIKIQEAGWYQEYNLTTDIRIIFMPAKHWGKRGTSDTNKTLWGSFVIISDKTKIFFAGDTAYDEHIFNEIRSLVGDIDICILPIGAYSPQWFMSSAHINPEEAVTIFFDLGGKCLIPMHYGTYNLSDEPPSEPIKILFELGKYYNIKDKIKSLNIGEEFLMEVAYRK
ncbi:MAG: MBL fold metallo-hydrolase [Marinilabiliaceae bacterium]|nr:MBL fold metallo-hydrolase [Marinilabiliaceae bacterium]